MFCSFATNICLTKSCVMMSKWETFWSKKNRSKKKGWDLGYSLIPLACSVHPPLQLAQVVLELDFSCFFFAAIPQACVRTKDTSPIHAYPVIQESNIQQKCCIYIPQLSLCRCWNGPRPSGPTEITVSLKAEFNNVLFIVSLSGSKSPHFLIPFHGKLVYLHGWWMFYGFHVGKSPMDPMDEY